MITGKKVIVLDVLLPGIKTSIFSHCSKDKTEPHRVHSTLHVHPILASGYSSVWCYSHARSASDQFLGIYCVPGTVIPQIRVASLLTVVTAY